MFATHALRDGCDDLYLLLQICCMDAYGHTWRREKLSDGAYMCLRVFFSTLENYFRSWKGIISVYIENKNTKFLTAGIVDFRFL